MHDRCTILAFDIREIPGDCQPLRVINRNFGRERFARLMINERIESSRRLRRRIEGDINPIRQKAVVFAHVYLALINHSGMCNARKTKRKTSRQKGVTQIQISIQG
ncbi:MAG: hypothetical protein WBC90_10695 [Albidovulum sp.]